MTIGSVNRTVTLLTRLINPRKSTTPIVRTAPQKTACRLQPVDQPFERVSPESQGLSSAMIASFLEELRGDTSLNMHSLLLLRNGKIVTETTFSGQDSRVWKMTFSACKSITSLAIGMLVDDGKLSVDDPVIGFFPDKVTPVTRLKCKDLTIRHLLTMTSGTSFNEAESMTETDWIRSFFSAAFTSRPGKTFAYNSLNTYMLSAIVKRVSGENLTAFLTPRLFEPLGITHIFWETCPSGIEKGGWGLYIGNEDLAKIGQLVLQKGLWNGNRLISESWIAEATSFKEEAPAEDGDFNYGYQIWCGRENTSFLFNGMLGQNVWGFPDSGILLVTNAGNDELFQQSRYFPLVQKYFSGVFPASLPEDPMSVARLKAALAALQPVYPTRLRLSWWQRLLRKKDLPFPDECLRLDGMTLSAGSPDAASVGLLPLLLQATQNNYTTGLETLSFAIEKGQFWIVYTEKGEDHRFPVSFETPVVEELYFHGEPYRVSIFGRFATDEDNHTVLILLLHFLETPCSRRIKVFFEKDQVRLRQEERPGIPLLQDTYTDLRERLGSRPLIGTAMEKLDDEYLFYRIRRVMAPELILHYPKS